jgi:alkanesulfonate monooxygenase SsuD/methylene tetrahydromethanopterin reductase-like flavin-dependent oxidoreductase (luciferase family)
MKFGLLYEFEVPKPWDDRSEYRIFHEAADQVVYAEQMGFEYVWAVEHHFLGEFAHMSAPEVWLGYMAARTSTIRLGHGVVLLPGKVNHPIRVAERIATLDIMSNGRVEFGTGRSSSPWQIEPFGVDIRTTREEWEEAVQIIPRMWMEDWFRHDGQFWQIPERQVLPRPIQKPHPPIWVAVAQPDTYELAGRKGIGILCFTVAAPGELEANIRRYREAIANPTEQVGAFKNEQVGAFTLVACDENRQAARDLGGENGLWYFETIKKIYNPVWQGKSLDDIPPSYRWHAQNVTQAERLRTQDKLDYNALIDSGAFCMGNPDDCIRAIERYEAAGADQLLAFVQIGRIPHERIMNTLRLFGKYVIPHFQEKAKRNRPALMSDAPSARG